jgi:hypothetical protein
MHFVFQKLHFCCSGCASWLLMHNAIEDDALHASFFRSHISVALVVDAQ